MLDYKLIEALAMVVQEGGFDKAARRLHITQSAVSQRLRLLEEQTGQILLARTTPPHPTPAGQQMVRHYLQVKRLEDDLWETFSPEAEPGFVTLAVGINADSLVTWFAKIMRPFLMNKHLLLDVVVDDQERTHRLLKNGEVMGCISAREHSLQGCRTEFLGRMPYRLVATPDFVARWFPRGLDEIAACNAPLLIFNRKDELHVQLFKALFGIVPSPLAAHYLPSSELFVDFITTSLAYGMLPDLQSADLLKSGHLVDLAPDRHVSVDLYWHCWNLKSPLLKQFSRVLRQGAKRLLES